MACAILAAACSAPQKEETPNSELDRIIESFWNTSAMNPTGERFAAMGEMQPYMDSCSAPFFYQYVNEESALKRREMENGTVLHFYQAALEKLVREIPQTTVRKGTVAIWHLYNMGYVIKTPSHCFAVDLKHPESDALVPYLDFLLITHHHGDHYTDKLNKAMTDAHKPVYSNWDSDVCSLTNLTDVRDVDLGDIKFHTEIVDHNKTHLKFVITYFVDCGPDTDNCKMYFVGDACSVDQLNPVGPVDIFVPHLAVGLDVKAAGEKFEPGWIFVSHLLELGHKLTQWRWSYFYGLDEMHEYHRKNVCIPVWGEKIVYTPADYR